jgi:Protein of unknown function (DUF4232)
MRNGLIWAVPLVLAVAACDGGGAQEAGPVPTASTPVPSESTPATAPEPPPAETGGTTTAPSALCSSSDAAVQVAEQEGAAGTIRTLWRIRHTGSEVCRSFGYPGMDFRASGGWLDVQVERGGMQDIDDPRAHVVVPAGGSLYFVSYWSDVDTDAGPCREFDRVKVTLPDNFVSAQLATSGCLDPESVRVGPVRTSPPS